MKKKSKHRNVASQASSVLVFKDEGLDERYAFVIAPLGDRRFELIDDKGVVGVGKLKGSIRRNERLLVGGLCLTQFRGDSNKSDIINVYTDIDTKQLRKYGELGDLDREKAKHDDSNFDCRHIESDVVFEDGSECSDRLIDDI